MSVNYEVEEEKRNVRGCWKKICWELVEQGEVGMGINKILVIRLGITWL